MSDILIKGIELPKEVEVPVSYTVWPKGHTYIHWDGTVYGETKAIEMPPHGRLIDADQLQEVLNLTLSLVMTDILTDKEIGLVHKTIGAISDAVNNMDTILEANK